MPLIWYILKTFTFDLEYTYLLVSVAVLKRESETERFYEESFLQFHTLGCIGILLFTCIVDIKSNL